jgi:uncharacterized protein
MTRALIDDFLSGESYAIAGVSRSSNKFGNALLKEMLEKGMKVYPVNPHAENILNVKCYPSLSSLPGPVWGLVTVLRPEQTASAVRDAAGIGIKRIWMQQGSESSDAINYCNDRGIKVIHGHCILMFLEPLKSFHKIHRFFLKLFGKYPR